MAAKKHAGRRGAAEISKELLSILFSLSEPGDFASQEAIQKRLGCDQGHAEKLIAMLECISGDPSGITAYEDEDGLAIGVDGAHGRALRLTKSETRALLDALRKIGTAQSEELRAELEGCLADGALDQALVERAPSTTGRENDAEAYAICSKAIARRKDVEFVYRKPDCAPELRRVHPWIPRHSDEASYLRGWDLDKHLVRMFRIDRMSNVKLVARTGEDVSGAASDSDARVIKLAFREKRFLKLFDWPELVIHSTNDGGEAVGTLPYYGGMWLPRQIAGCGGAVVAHDEEVAALVREYATELLASTE